MATKNRGTDGIINLQLAHRIGIQVSSAGLTADEKGELFLAHLSPVGGAENPLTNRGAILSFANDATAKGLIYAPQGINFTQLLADGEATLVGDDIIYSVSLLTQGVVDVNSMPVELSAPAVTALNKITLQAGWHS